MIRKTEKMLGVEERMGESLEVLIPDMVTRLGLSGTADEIGISKATLSFWMLKMDIEVRRVALLPGDKLELTRQCDGSYQDLSNYLHRGGTDTNRIVGTINNNGVSSSGNDDFQFKAFDSNGYCYEVFTENDSWTTLIRDSNGRLAHRKQLQSSYAEAIEDAQAYKERKQAV